MSLSLLGLGGSIVIERRPREARKCSAAVCFAPCVGGRECVRVAMQSGCSRTVASCACIVNAAHTILHERSREGGRKRRTVVCRVLSACHCAAWPETVGTAAN